MHNLLKGCIFIADSAKFDVPKNKYFKKPTPYLEIVEISNIQQHNLIQWPCFISKFLISITSIY